MFSLLSECKSLADAFPYLSLSLQSFCRVNIGTLHWMSLLADCLVLFTRYELESESNFVLAKKIRNNDLRFPVSASGSCLRRSVRLSSLTVTRIHMIRAVNRALYAAGQTLTGCKEETESCCTFYIDSLFSQIK